MSESLEMQDRSSSEAEQGQRLLSDSDDEIIKGEKLYQVQWRLRTGWVILLSILTVILVFVLMIAFTTYFIVDQSKKEITTETELKTDFRRLPSEYVLDPLWDCDAPRTIRKYKWTIIDRVLNPDGIYRPMITVDGQFPGPMIECNEGDTLVIEVDNRSRNATSIHFHGIFQNGTNWMDGTTGITQCPIAPGRKFIYEFTLNGQSGTYYYHGHQAVQIADGLFGPLVVHSRDERSLQKIPYVTDRVVMLQDYYLDLSSVLLRDTLSPGVEGDPIPDGALINGRNTRDCEISPGRMCDNSTAGLSVFDLAPNENHRLRLLNVGAFAWFEVGLDHHPLAITEVDGTDVLPSYREQLHISPAQRYSVIVNTNQTSRNSFWFRARMITHCFTNPEKPGHGMDEARAIINYSKVPTPPSTVKSKMTAPKSSRASGFAVQCFDLPLSSFKPVPEVAAPAKPDHVYYIRTNIQIGDWRLQRGFFNISTFRPSLRSPSLYRSIAGLSSDDRSFTNFSTNTDLSPPAMTNSPNGINAKAFHLQTELVIQHTGTPVIDLVIQNFDEMTHPLHLHGHKFWVLAQGHAYFPGHGALNISSNPLRRDTASVEGFGWMLIRFVADNPGMWAFHCHMAWHSEAGLLMQFLSRTEIVRSWEVPEQNRRLCEVEMKELEKGAAPKDDIWYGFGIG